MDTGSDLQKDYIILIVLIQLQSENFSKLFRAKLKVSIKSIRVIHKQLSTENSFQPRHGG
ncbi:hypothetical protein I79_000071 [Cricetulus griseus]|uniref:Uncharacterized protein n=1 Tax=Cricetulus griseus TaxID=10029 RepID=G3GRC8_CRIGR|nr:hypothetical protein I79_000071 [Cricetulus griseus]